ncbi:MAG: hypothetical protein KAR45_23030, partial [Desulfobacteraceae bacterium]|nr:hypothetical protein [Desulfobacteraceae bacterium]
GATGCKHYSHHSYLYDLILDYYAIKRNIFYFIITIDIEKNQDNNYDRCVINIDERCTKE